MGMFNDDSFGGLGGTLNGIGSSLNDASRNPLFLAGLQMLANGSPQINKIPNTLDGVPNLLLTAGTQQEKMRLAAEERRRQLQKEADEQAGTSAALQKLDFSPDDASLYSRSSTGRDLILQQRQQQADAQRLRDYNNPPDNAPASAPASAPAAAPPQQQQAAQPDPMQQARDTAAAKFDNFGLASVGKTVEGFAASLGDKDKASKFIAAAQASGLQPNSPITGQVLSNPAVSGPLARSIGVGADLPDDQWQAAHSQAVQVSRQRQAARAAQAEQYRSQQQQQAPAPAAPPPAQPTPQAQPMPQAQAQQAPAVAPPQPQVPAQPQTVTEQAVARRQAALELEGLNRELRRQKAYLSGSKPNSGIYKAAELEVVNLQKQIAAAKDALTASDRNAAEKIPAGVDPDEYRKQKAKNAVAEEGTRNTRLQAGGMIIQSVDEAVDLIKNNTHATGLTGKALAATISNSAAARLDRAFELIRANTSINKLQEMRVEGGGGALGSVTEGEHRLLAATAGELTVGASPAELREKLARYRWVQQDIISGGGIKSKGASAIPVFKYDKKTNSILAYAKDAKGQERIFEVAE